MAIIDGDGGDSPQFGPLVKKTAERFTINEVPADMAYSSRDNLRLVENVGGKAYIPYKKNATGRAGGSALWKKMYHYFRLNRDEFMDHYHKRSNIEATNAAIKRKFGETWKSKNPVAQVNELLAKMVQSLSERNLYIPTIDVYYSWQRSTISFLSLLFSRRLLPPSYL